MNNRKNLYRILLLLGFMLPTEVLAIYMEYTYFNEMGFVLSVIVTFLLVFFTQVLNEKKIWFIGNMLTLLMTFVFEEMIDHNRLFALSRPSIYLLAFIFIVCWLLPQFLGVIWGHLYISSKKHRISTSNKIELKRQEHV